MNGLFIHWSRGWGVLSFSKRLVISCTMISKIPLQCMCNQKILSNCPLCLSIQCLYQLWGQPLCYHCVQVAACNWQSHCYHQPWTHRSGGWNHYRCILGPNTIQRCLLTGLGNTLVEIRWSKDHLISTPVFPLLVRHHLCVESGPWVSFQYDVYPKV